MQRGRVVLGGGALGPVGGRRRGAVRQAARRHALADARVHARARHLEAAQLAQREGSHVQQAAVGAAQLLQQHLRRQRRQGRYYFANVGGYNCKLPYWICDSRVTI